MFLSILLGILFVANFVIFEAVKLSMGNVLPLGTSWLLAGLLAIGALSFIGSLFLGRKYYNFFTRTYSWLSMVWIGLFGYLFFGSVLYVLEVALIGDPTRYVALTLLGISILTCIYGIIHAQNIKIKGVKVNLSNLSDVWKGRKALFISDLHVGQINGKKFVERVVREIKKIAPDIVCIGGDLFDGSSVPAILENITPFKDLTSAHGIHFIMGNHEGYGTAQAFLDKIKEVGINILNDQKVVIDGVQIVGVDYITTTGKEDFKHILETIGINRNSPSILLKHEPRHVDVAEEAGISLQISGHTHKAQQWPFEYFARMIYGQFTYGLSRSKNIQVYTSSGVGTWGPPLRVATNSEIVVFTFS